MIRILLVIKWSFKKYVTSLGVEGSGKIVTKCDKGEEDQAKE